MKKTMTDRWRAGDTVVYRKLRYRVLLVDSALRSVDPTARTTYKLEHVPGWIPENELRACPLPDAAEPHANEQLQNDEAHANNHTEQ